VQYAQADTTAAPRLDVAPDGTPVAEGSLQGSMSGSPRRHDPSRDTDTEDDDDDDGEAQDHLGNLRSPARLTIRRMSEMTDPDMPSLVPVELEEVGASEAMNDALTWDGLPTIDRLAIERVMPADSTLSAEESEAESAIQRAEMYLASVDCAATEEADLSSNEDNLLRAAESLKEAVQHGCRSTVEAAVDLLLLMFRVADASTLRPTMQALAMCTEFPRHLAAHAARLLMLRPSWPGRDESARRFCQIVALSDPLGVVLACLDLVPRKTTREMLGFSWLLEPLADQLARPYKVGDRVVAVTDFMSDSKERIPIKKGLQGDIREVDSDGDMSVKFDGHVKRNWVLRRHADRICLANCNSDALPCAVTLLCDDAGGPPLCASSARALLMRISESVGSASLRRQPGDERLSRKAKQCSVLETLRKLHEYQSVSASE